MKPALSKLLLLLAAVFGLSLQGQEKGLEPDWDIRAVLKEISAHAGRLLPVLDQVDAKSWTAKGASDTYVAQSDTCKVQAKALSSDALELAKDPEKFSEALKVYFRMQSLEFLLGSLEQGIRKYQNPALAEMLSGLVAENGANRERFQRYIVDLAADREQQFRVMDHEAQRCRAFLARQPAPVTTTRKK